MSTFSRRNLLVGTATVAAVAGMGVAWWLDKPALASDAVSSLVPGFWDLQWDTPQGQLLAMRKFQGHPLLINFWATWCPPCVEELPLINSFFNENKSKGWQVLGLAVDKVAPVRSFLEKLPLDFPVGMAAAAGTDLSRALGNPGGGLPFSVVLTSDGAVAQRKMGRVTSEDLHAWLGLK